MPSCVFVIEQALSVRALQEMVTAESEENEEESKSSGSGGHRTLLYGHAVLLRHGYSNMYLACLSTSSSKDKLSFDVGLRENSQGEACWWTIHPASKQRSEGEKVRVGDDLILVSVATERYLVSAPMLSLLSASSDSVVTCLHLYAAHRTRRWGRWIDRECFLPSNSLVDCSFRNWCLPSEECGLRLWWWSSSLLPRWWRVSHSTHQLVRFAWTEHCRLRRWGRFQPST